MREKMKKGIAYLLSSVLFVSTFITALPQLTITAHAEDTGKAIQLVTGGAADNIVGAQKSNVYFGTYLQSGDKTNGFNQDPIKWRVLSNSDRKLFLLSDKNLDVGEYHLSDDAVTWKGSTIRSWLNGYDGSANDLKENYSEKKSDSFLGTAFSEKELAVIPSVKINNPPTVFENYSTPGCEDTNDKVYLLSIDEATDTAYGFTDNYISTDTRTSANTAYVGAGGKTGDASNTFDEGKNDVWWLRSPGRSDNEATFVSSIGYVYQPGNSVSNSSVALRPALNINLESILFTSAAKDGKISGNVGADALTAVADYSGDDWKLTVEDSERDLFQARRLDNNEITAGGKVKIKYYGALEGTNEYVSAIITDSAGTILYYGNIASCASSTKGEAEINIPDSFAPGYKLYVFSEQCNGDYKTDYSSKLIDVTEPSKSYSAINIVKGDVSYYIDGAQESNVYFGTYPQNLKEGSNEVYNIDPIKWRVLSNTDGKLFLLSDQSLDCKQYHTVQDSATWAESTVRWWLNGYEGSPIAEDKDVNYANDNFIKTAFNDEEQEAIPTVTIKNDKNFEYGTDGGKDTSDKVYLLSLDEIIKPGYGFSSKSSATYEKSGRVSLNTAYAHKHGAHNYINGAGDWWLRSPGIDASNAANVYSHGNVHRRGSDVSSSRIAIRPALNINLESVLFTSAATGGKSSVKVGSDALSTVNPITPADDVEWKFTIEDSDRESFAAERLDSNKIAPGETVSIEYNGAITGENEYVSAIITDSDDNILYYGRIDKCDTSDNNGESVDIIIPDENNITSECKLYVFNEQCNGDYKTDYSSKLINLTAPKKAPSADDFIVNTPSDLAFNGKPKEVTATVKENITGMGLITVEYYDGEMKLDSAPSEPGTYNFKLNVGKGTEYKASIVENDEWKYTITMNAPAINTVNNATAWNIAGRQKHNVYFGTYPQSENAGGGYNIGPIKWRVLSNSDGKLFLLSDQNLDYKPYHTVSDSVTWAESTIRWWLNGYEGSPIAEDEDVDYADDNFIKTAFNDDEQEAIFEVKIVNNDNDIDNYPIPGGEDTNDKVYLLSLEEIIKPGYGFSSDYSAYYEKSGRVSLNTVYAHEHGAYTYSYGAGDWWLRSPGNDANCAASVYSNGFVHRVGDNVTSGDIAVRPALNINLKSILFTSAAVGGKDSFPAGEYAFKKVATYEGTDWKVTVHDPSRDGLTVTRDGYGNISAGSSIAVKYENATVGTKTNVTSGVEFLSAVLLKEDDSENILYYGNIVDLTDPASSASGTAYVNIPADLEEGEYILKFFSEQRNGDYLTDLASKFDDERTISVTVGEDENVYINTRKAIQMNSDVLSVGMNSTREDTPVVYFDSNKSEGEIPSDAWYVIGYGPHGAASADGKITLLAKDFLGNSEFNSEENGINEYFKSTLYNFIGGSEGLEKRFSVNEEKAVVPKTLTGGSGFYNDNGYNANNIRGDSVIDALMWPLSTEEADLTNEDIRKMGEGFDYSWWLRSPGQGSDAAALVFDIGLICDWGQGISCEYGVRPALNLNQSAILFTSAAKDGKISGDTGADALMPIADNYDGNEWKLTILDYVNDREGLNVKLKDQNKSEFVLGSNVDFTYENAITGTNEYISAMLFESGEKNSSTPLYYGRIVDLSDSSASAGGEALFTVPEDLKPGKYDLKFFSEQYNGDYLTDVASSFGEARTISFEAVIGEPEAELFDITLPESDSESGKIEYDGKKKEVNVNIKDSIKDDIKGIGDVTIRYFDENQNELTDAPTEPGKYTYEIVIGKGKCYDEKTLTDEDFTFTIDKRTPKADDFDVTIPKDKDYNGESVTAGAKLKDGLSEIGKITLVYYKNGVPITGEPTEAGEYTIGLNVDGTGKNFEAIEGLTNDEWKFVINKIAPKASDFKYTVPSFTYDGKAKNVDSSVSSKKPGMGDITVTYYKNGVSITGEPVEAGDYTFTISVSDQGTDLSAEEMNFTGADDLTDSSWKFSIEKATPKATYFKVDLPENATYDGTPKEAFAKPISNLDGIGTYVAEYYDNKGEKLDSAPVEPGEYTVKINVAKGTNYEKAVLDGGWKFTIATTDYEVKLVTNGGTVNKNDVNKYTYGTGAALPSFDDIEKTGYTFEGWFDNAAFNGNPVTEITSKDSGKKTYYAKWSANEYTVAFNANGGEGTMADQSRTYDDKASLNANVFTFEGRTFNGWNTAKDGTGIPYADKETANLSSTNEDTVTLYAQWTVNTFTVTWKNYDGSVLKTLNDVPYGSAVYFGEDAPTKPSTDDYTYEFDKWSPEEGVIKGATTYTATYTEKAIIKEKRTATVNDFVFTPPSDLTYDGNGKIATVSKKEGTDNLIFKTEYYDDKGNKFTDGTFPSEPGTYFVKVKVFENDDFKEDILENNEWKFVISPCDYAVSLIANGGTFKGSELTGYTYTVGAALPTADDIERTGYTFEGWYENADFGSEAVTAILPTDKGDKTFYAKWKIKTFAVTWVNYDGSVLKTLNDVPYGSAVYFGEDAPTKPTTDDYTYEFDKWSPEEGEITEDTTYTATYTEKAIIKEKKTATVNDFVFTPPSDLTYDGNGKSATVSKKEGTDNLIFKTEYYDDKGNKLKDGTFPSEPGTYFVKVKVFEDDDFKEGTLEDSEWKFVISPCDYAVSLIANGGTFKGNELTGYTYTVGAALPTADDIERTGYTFEGWYENADLSGEAVMCILPTDKGDKVYYAKWKIKTFTVTWLNYDGSILYTLNDVPYGSTINYGGETPAKPSDDEFSYIFEAWSPEEGEITGDTAYTAVFAEKKNPYTITFDANGGSLDTETAITNDEYKLDTLPTPTLEGFNFKGWYTSAEDSIEVTTDTVFEEDTTVYALWEEIIEEEEPEKPKNTDYLDELYLRLAIAKELGGERTVTWDVGDSLPYDVLKIMDENPQITLIFTYTYLDVRYRVFISGKKTKANPNVPWAGPWYLLDAYKGKILTEDEE